MDITVSRDEATMNFHLAIDIPYTEIVNVNKVIFEKISKKNVPISTRFMALSIMARDLEIINTTLLQKIKNKFWLFIFKYLVY